MSVKLFAMALTSACVSVNLAPKTGERSKGVEYQPPPSPYSALKEARADGAWQNEINGNSISFFSTCNDSADPGLDSISGEIFADVSDLNVVQRNRVDFNAREALDVEIEGKVEGVTTRVRALIFKKNGCTYTLSLVGLPRDFAKDREYFEGFLRSFKAP